MGNLESRMLLPDQIVHGYKIVTRVGVGGFADVYKAVDTSTKKTIALKRFKETKLDYDDVLIEIESLKKAAHKNVARYIKSFNDVNTLYLVMEYCEFGTIDEFIKSKQPDDGRRLGLIKDIAAGLAHLHSLKIVHRDLKPANILIGSQYVAKLTDFGLAKILTKTERGAKKMEEIYMSTMAGTPVYMAPEVLDGHYNAQADIFSMGIVFCSVLDDQLKESVEKELIGLKYHMVQDYKYTVPATIGKFMQRLITGMLQKDYHMRPKAHEISTQLMQFGQKPGKVDLKSIKLLAVGMSSCLGVVVLPPSEASSLRKKGTQIKKITVHDLFHLTNPNVMNGAQAAGRDVTNADGTMVVHNIDVMFKSIGGSSGKIKLSKNASLAEMRRRLASESGIQEDLIEILHKSWPVGDDQPIEMQGIGQGSVVHVHAVNERERGMVHYEIDGALLDSQFNYDFTNVDDGNTRFIRGGYVYHRPCGWFRHALKVKGQYENDIWLGDIGTRTQSTHNEWPVSYHGSMMTSDNIPVGAGSAGVNGIITTPSLPLVVDKFIKTFEFEGNTYQIAFQNRINPDKANGHMVILSDDYWLSPKEDPLKKNYDVRPYGILIRKIDN